MRMKYPLGRLQDKRRDGKKPACINAAIQHVDTCTGVAHRGQRVSAPDKVAARQLMADY